MIAVGSQTLSVPHIPAQNPLSHSEAIQKHCAQECLSLPKIHSAFKISFCCYLGDHGHQIDVHKGPYHSVSEQSHQTVLHY